MTLILAASNADQIIQVSGRWPASGDQIPDDSATQAGQVVCDDASFLFGFTGVTRRGSHLTSRWLPDALRQAAKKGLQYREILQGLAQEADRHFHSSADLQGLFPADRRLTIMLSGYTADDFIVNAFVSNFQDFTKFTCHPEARAKFTVHAERSISRTNGNPATIHLVGRSRALAPADEEQLREMLLRRSPAEAIRQRAMALIQGMSAQEGAAGMAGGEINVARLVHAEPGDPIAGWASNASSDRIPPSDRIDLRSNDSGATSADLRPGRSFPVVHRNAPCPCGSGKKYRACHRKPD